MTKWTSQNDPASVRIAQSRITHLTVELDNDDVRIIVLALSYTARHWNNAVKEITGNRTLGKEEKKAINTDKPKLDELGQSILTTWITGGVFLGIHSHD